MKIIDWNKVKSLIKERNPVEVSAGILEDWFMTAATVWKDGQWTDDKKRAYVLSGWATPGIKMEMKNGDIIELACHRRMNKKDHADHFAQREKLKKDLMSQSMKKI